MVACAPSPARKIGRARTPPPRRRRWLLDGEVGTMCSCGEPFGGCDGKAATTVGGSARERGGAGYAPSIVRPLDSTRARRRKSTVRSPFPCVEQLLIMFRMKHPHGLPADLNALVALDMLLSERSVTAAAKRLGVTQSAMSHTLKRLRETLADPLFVSARSGLVPTARALELSLPLRRALVDLGAAVTVGAPFDPIASTKRFVLATADYGELVAVPRLLADVRAEAPNVRIEVQRVAVDVVARLEAGTVDVVAGMPIPPMANLRRTTLATERFVVLARRDHPRIKRGLDLKRYVALPHLLIAPAGAPGGVVDDWLVKRGLERQVVLRVPQFASAPFVVASSDLLLTAPEGLAIWARPFLDLAELPPPMAIPPTRSFATWHERNQGDPAHQWFRTKVMNAASREGAT